MRDVVMDQAIVRAAQLVLIEEDGVQDCRGASFSHPRIIEDGAVGWRGERIVWTGTTSGLLEVLPPDSPVTLHDAHGCVVTPGLIDAHTHLVFDGTREDEFEARIAGKSYMEISREGGGIKRTVRQTRQADLSRLIETGLQRLDAVLDLGVTTVEIKSGYGLNTETELKMLRAARSMNERHPVDVVTTFLGAHDIPPDTSREAYLSTVVDEMIPAVVDEGLAEFCDVFMEKGVFTAKETRNILEAAMRAGLRPKLHADQLSDSGGARLAAIMGAVSADHLNFTSTEGIESLAASACIGVLLPGSDFFLGLTHYPAARDMIGKGVAVALATDFNPGSCMTFNLPLIMTIACTQMRMTPAETLTAVTQNAAAAIGRSDSLGSLRRGKQADFVLFQCSNYPMICYHFGTNHVRNVFKRGKLVRGGPRYIDRRTLQQHYTTS